MVWEFTDDFTRLSMHSEYAIDGLARVFLLLQDFFIADHSLSKLYCIFKPTFSWYLTALKYNLIYHIFFWIVDKYKRYILIVCIRIYLILLVVFAASQMKDWEVTQYMDPSCLNKIKTAYLFRRNGFIY